MVSDLCTRRSALKGIGAIATVSLAGCTEDGGNGGNGGGNGGNGGNGNGGTVGDTDGDTITLAWADHFPSGDFISLDLTSRYVMDQIEEESGGEVQFEYYPGGELGGADETMELIRQGAIDIGHVVPQYYSDRLEFTQLGVLPGLAPSGVVGGQAMHDLLMPHREGQIFEAEWEELGLRPLLTAESDSYEIATVDDPIETLEDLEGMNMRSGGGIADNTVSALGASPVAMDAAEIYQSLERGTIDGDFNAAHLWEVFTIYEIINYCTFGAPLNATTLVEAISLDTWEGLPDHVQELFIEQSDQNPIRYGEEMFEYLSDIVDEFESEHGIEVNYMEDDEIERWEEVLQAEAVDPWVEGTSDPETGQELLDAYTDGIEEYR
ncbi:TRAP transporter substrate-binding protein [Natrarchaeobius sp. A-rgal3]|uniref:TRAP transporter substrate-binding protein n=1 Tax=Natrarchaeobius versutus TaxID=1679078 RepID=UPI00350FE7C3